MPARLPLTLLCLAALAWPPAPSALPFGVLNAQAKADPARIPQGGKTAITVAVRDGFHKPIALAAVKISAATGYFEASNQTAVIGHTDQDGLFKAVWHANLRTENGRQVFAVTATKNGHVGQYPLTATAAVDVGEPAE